MPIGPEFLVPVGGIIAAFILNSSAKKKKKSRTKSVGKCPPYDVINRDEVIATAQQAASSGLVGKSRVAAYVAQVLYPTDTKGITIPWPKQSPFVLPPDAPEAIVCLYAEIKNIVNDLPIPDEPEPPAITPGQILTGLLSDTPTLGKFYLVKSLQVDPDGIALGGKGLMARALNKAVPGSATSSNRLSLLRLMSQPGTWNPNLYSRDKFTGNWPAYTGVDGKNIGTAWLPRNKAAITTIASGKIPQRNIDVHGAKVGTGTSYGLLWFPPIDVEALQNLGAVTDGGVTWSDGSSVLNPPPELLEMLTA